MPDLVHHLTLSPQAQWLHDLDLLFRHLPEARTARLPLLQVLEREAEALRDAHRAGLPAAAELVRLARWRPDRPADSHSAILATELTLEQARQAIARWHRFPDWPDVLLHAHETVEPLFEAAADAIVAGDAGALRSLLDRDPSLLRARSPFAHHATLLHYVAANGVEESRQWQSPRNAAEIAGILLRAGADPDALCDCYGGGMTALTLLVSSDHPARAGVQTGLVETLLDFGAAIDGVEGTAAMVRRGAGQPLMTALAFGYPAAAETLARRGARVDNIVAAAGLGRLDLVRRFVNEDGSLRAGVVIAQ